MMAITSAVHDAIYVNLARVRGCDVADARCRFPMINDVIRAYGMVLVEIWSAGACLETS